MVVRVGRNGALVGLLALLAACAGGAVPPDSVPTSTPAVATGTDDAPARDLDAVRPDAGLVAAGTNALPGPDPDAFAMVLDGRAAASAVASRPVGTEVGYLLLDLDSGLQLAALNADLPLIPASTTKLATAVVALDVLGEDYRFRTELLADGPVHDGVLQGDLILRGGGDPEFDIADMLELAVRLETRGIRRVEGRFLIDDTLLPRLSEIDPTQPLEAAYNPGIGALSLAFNRVRVKWGGDSTEVATVPPLAEAHFETTAPKLLPPGGVELEKAGDQAVMWRIADRGRRRQEISLPVKDAGLHAGHVFRRLASAQGITLGPPQRGTTPEDAQRLAVHLSAPLRDLVHDMLLYSNNMVAELVGLTAARRLGDDVTDLDSAGALLVSHLSRLMPQADWEGATLGNHSGLDGSARLTARQLAAIVRYGWRDQALVALLPGGGWSGTLARRFDDADEALRVWAKTGTMNYGSALAGYLFPTTDRPAVFVIMVSDRGAREIYDALPKPDRGAEAAAGGWINRARKLQDDLVDAWLRPLPTS